MSTETEKQMIHLTIDGQEVAVPKGTTVYHAAEKLSIDIPIFCYQDRMPPFGACRMCLVEVEKMPKLQTSCTLEAAEGMVVKTHSKMAEEGRKGILEYLLINHPLDCPICDKGGECPLQENTVKFGPDTSRFYEEKVRFKKPLPLGPVLTLDRERCIICARCTRFGEIIAGDHALEFVERGYRTEVGTPDQNPVESKFIGNTIMICPVGALTSEVYRFRARPWDNDSMDSTCTLCPVGCSMILDSRDGEIVRTRSRENREVNDIWLCDKGWFGYEFTYSPDRLQKPLVRNNGQLEPANWDEALSRIADVIKKTRQSGKLAGLGGNTLTVEENYLFQKLMRETIGVDHVDHRIGMPIFSLDEEGMRPGTEISIGETEELSSVFLFGIDLTEEFPVIWLRLKQAINRGATVHFVGNYAPEIAQHLAKTKLHPPGKELNAIREHLSEIKALAEKGKKTAIFIGRQYLHTPHRKLILSELLKLKQEVPHLILNLLDGQGNSMGARYAGMHPELGPCGKRLEKPGLNAIQIMESAASKGWDFLYVAGANPAVHFPSKLWKAVREKLGFLVVQDIFLTETAQEADVVLPAFSFVEKEGSFLNIEGRIQKIHRGKDLPEGIYNDAEIFTLLAEKLNYNLILDENFLHTLKSGRLNLPQADKVEGGQLSQAASNKEGLLATFAPKLFDHGVRMKHDPHLVQLAKEPKARLHPNEGTKRGIQDGAVVNLTANNNTIKSKIKFDRHVSEGAIVLPLGFSEVPVYELGTNLLNGLEIKIEKIC